MFARKTLPHLPLLATLALAAALVGCKQKPAPVDDGSLTSQLQSRIAADQAVAGQPIQASVQAGIATLNGSVNDAAQRELASRDAAGIDGIRQVVNNLTVQSALPATVPPPTVAAVAPPPPIIRTIVKPTAARVQPQPAPQPPAPIERAERHEDPPPPPPSGPPPPPQPTFRTITVPAGTMLPIRITETLDSATTQTGDNFSGSLATDLIVDGIVVAAQGTAVTGHVDAVQEAAHFKGSSLIAISLTSLNRRGERTPLVTDPYSVKGKGRGETTALKTGIGAGAGAILGGILGGGKGAAIGAAAGGGAGAGSSAITRGQQVQIPSESVVRFNLGSPIQLRVQTSGPNDREEGSPEGLRPRP